MLGRLVLASALLVGGLADALPAQDILYYKFDDGGGRRVINYAAPGPKAPREAMIVSRLPDSQTWAKGRFGSALMGAQTPTAQNAYVDTGWDQQFRGSLTVAFFYRFRSPIQPGSVSWVFAGPNRPNILGGFQGTGFKILNVEGIPTLRFDKRDLVTPAFQRWVHLAIVLDDPSQVARLYVDGRPEIPLAMRGQPYLNRGIVDMRVGGPGVGPDRNNADIDEFRLSLRAVPPAEIAAWSARAHAAQARFGVACFERGRSVLLDSSVAKTGPPRIGNGAYRLELFGPAGSTVALGFGSNRLRLRGLPLPLDLKFLDPRLAGCLWLADADLLVLSGMLDRAGTAAVPLPIPNDTRLVGATLYTQALMRNPITRATMMTNALAISVGH